MTENQYPDLTANYSNIFSTVNRKSAIGNGLAVYMVRSPARRVRRASCRAFFDPNSQTENCFRRTTYGFGLQTATQYFRASPCRRITTFRTPTMPDEPLRLGTRAHQLRRFRAGGPSFATNFR